ncbi:conjugal transfer protein TrbL [Xanthomonas campestris pv. raphani]|uniref:conjugal transfer protein TrbL n=1 Tax=Xanthomonas campestris TaxID=339 RepID=UPI0038910705
MLYRTDTMFSMEARGIMSISMQMVSEVVCSPWAMKGCHKGRAMQRLGRALSMDLTNGITSQAMQTGGMGVLLTLLILTTPPMAAFFFQGTLGSFMAYSQIGGATSAGGSPGPQGQAPGSYTPAQSVNTSPSSQQSNDVRMGGGGTLPQSSNVDTGAKAAHRDLRS